MKVTFFEKKKKKNNYSNKINLLSVKQGPNKQIHAQSSRRTPEKVVKYV